MNINQLESFKLSDAIKFHDKLNPKLFANNKPRPEVKKQLLIIAKDFISELGIKDLDVDDVTISGSNAAYTYTDHSDLDLHILVDFKKLPNDEVYQELFNAKKTIYNDSHAIKVHGVPIELYVQNSNEPVISLGEYSLLQNKWLRIPVKRRANLDQTITKQKYNKLYDLVQIALKSKKIKKIEELLKTMRRYRQAGLDRGGEFSPENLSYKALRSQGWLTKLYKLRDLLHSKELSIESLYSEDYDPNGPPPGPEFKPTMPRGTVRVDVSDVYDWYKLGQHISNMKGLGKHDFGKGPPSTILSFGDEDTEHKYIKDLEKTGLTTTDIDPIDPKQPKGMKRQKVDPTYNVNEQQKRNVVEGISPIVYHYTRAYTAKKILAQGEFELSSTLGSVEEQYAPKGYPYFLSTTRTRRGGYHETIGSDAVLFVLDGAWYGRHYKAAPVDYWQNRDPLQSHHRSHEAEDRIFSKEPKMSVKGVKEIHIYVSPDAEGRTKAWARQDLILAKRLGIAAYFYTDKSAWRNLDTRKTGDMSILKGKDDVKGYVRRHKGYLIPWVELIKAGDKKQLSSKANEMRYGLVFKDYYLKDIAQGLANDLNNARKPESGPDREHAVNIIRYMQANKLNNVMDIVNNLADKWKSLSTTNENLEEATAISLSNLPRFFKTDDPLADLVPERKNAIYALHPDKWESTFFSLTNKDPKKLKYYRPKEIDIPEGTLVGDMALANLFYRAKSEEEKQKYATLYRQSLKPYPVDLSNYRMPELLIPSTISESASGYIPSEKEKNDPRYKTALTVDIKPDTIKKNAKAFGFKVSRAGIPPLLRK